MRDSSAKSTFFGTSAAVPSALRGEIEQRRSQKMITFSCQNLGL
ncbi:MULTISPECIES: hypothetical protein [Ensifer]|uniref:Uncharacterized protein n=1 Tax=Ensifer adhaerens TaxID=106592 RepID=A0ABY8HRH8_ENSAD|nr:MULTISPECIES: hypothetical protein [Ensifer]WFP94712.1 hypothetical protein P4B07_33510 [Ensifer adhaerens]